ncbi:MAG: DUF4296 domain-containing protein [Flavobacteriales bacterium]|nr:DUF4296 domain-containing protein [Flavobacteriales bacterium]MBQ5815549.1 DUF4296 domain-containing protein [Flavobacteriales bacterium]
MRNVKFWATGVVVLLCMTMMTSCKYRYIEKPDQLLTHEQMVDIICEVAYVEALEARGAFIHDSTLSRIGKKAFLRRIYQKYGVNHEVLSQNNDYYSEHSKEYIAIYREAMNRILVDENEYVEGIKRAEREAQAAAEAAIKAFNDSVTDARVRDSIILAREDSIMSLHRVKDKDAETEYVEEEFGTGGGWVFPKKNDK